MHNNEEWQNTLLKSCGFHTARLLEYVWPFFNIMYSAVYKITMRGQKELCNFDGSFKNKNEENKGQIIQE